MSHVAFVLWMVAFPLSISICNYLDTKRAVMAGRQSSAYDAASDVVRAVIGSAYFACWFGIGYCLYGN